MTSEERAAALDAIASEVRDCTRCRLWERRTQAVPGEGHPDTEVVFVGEGPGQNEDRLGRPFVGAAGGLLEELLGLIGWRREDVFITNIVKCRPPGNRDPQPDEVAACAPYLHRQLEALDPALVVTLGRHSLQAFMPGDSISRVHGTSRDIDPATGARAALGYAMYHPAAALRATTLRSTMERDMTAVPDTLLRARLARAGKPADAPAAVADAPAAVADAPAAVTDAPPPLDLPSAPPAGPQGSAGLMARPAGTPGLPASDDQLGLF